MLSLLLALTTTSQAGPFYREPEPFWVRFQVDLYLCPGNKIRENTSPTTATKYPGYFEEPFTRPLGDKGWLHSPDTRATCGVDHAVPAVTFYYKRDYQSADCFRDTCAPLKDAETIAVRAALAHARDLGSPEDRAAQRARECDAKRTDPLTLWVCPTGLPYVVYHPVYCPRVAANRVETEDHALPLEWNPILPEGETCGGLTTREEDIERALHLAASWHTAVPDLARKAYTEWQAAEQKALEAATYDCLAGICLNAEASSIPDLVVTVSEHQWNRKVEVCSGRVVAVSITAGWAQENFTWDDIPASVVQPLYYISAYTEVSERLQEAMIGLGWAFYDYPFAHHTGKKGVRVLNVSESMETYAPWGVGLSLKTTHPDKYNLCAPERQQGL